MWYELEEVNMEPNFPIVFLNKSPAVPNVVPWHIFG